MNCYDSETSSNLSCPPVAANDHVRLGSKTALRRGVGMKAGKESEQKGRGGEEEVVSDRINGARAAKTGLWEGRKRGRP
jgi:hypothetical protein